jgi:tRNA threonylcarbamoyladenosine biosynthesis protein TsaB
MDQVYAAEYRFADGRWTTLVAPLLADVAALAQRWRDAPPEAVAAMRSRCSPGASTPARRGAFPARAPTPTRSSPSPRAPGAKAVASTPPMPCRSTCATRVAQTTREREAARAAQGGGDVMSCRERSSRSGAAPRAFA